YLTTQEGQKLPVEHCVKYSYGWRINDEIEKALGECNTYDEKQFPIRKMQSTAIGAPYTIVFDKPTFGSVDLAKYLGGCYAHIQDKLEIELCGVCTDICVISNAMLLKATMPEAKIIVNSALCAGVTISSHERALGAMQSCQIEII
ncbi:MAG: isochorismatase family protein, partial [Clostridia bacterium]|nr:isochorismatase family protein [Clostridia bacterium]